MWPRVCHQLCYTQSPAGISQTSALFFSQQNRAGLQINHGGWALKAVWCPFGLNETSVSPWWEIFFLVYVTNIWRCFENAQVLEGPTSVVSTHNNQICNSNLDFFKIKNTKQHKIQLILRKFFFFYPNPNVELKAPVLLLWLPTKKQRIGLEIQHHLRMLDLLFCHLHVEKHKLQLAQP